MKIYTSRINDEVISECPINDIQSDKLSANIAKLAKKWKVQNFASQKQFFDTHAAFDSLYERLITEPEDAALATEYRYFLPEICTEHAGAGGQVTFSEAIDLMLPDGEKITDFRYHPKC